MLHRPAQSRQEIGHELLEVVVGFFEGEPGDGAAGLLNPHADGGRLAVAGRGGDEDEQIVILDCPGQPPEDVVAGDQGLPQERQADFGDQQRIGHVNSPRQPGKERRRPALSGCPIR